jgi:hypothetical protein
MIAHTIRTLIPAALLAALASTMPAAGEDARIDYRVLATKRTSTMDKEMNEAAAAGYRFGAVMGGQTAFGGNETVVVMMKDAGGKDAAKRTYRLLATSRTATMQKEMQQLGDEGFEYKGQTVFETGFAGREVVVIMEKIGSDSARRFEYRLLATSKTSTMDKELRESGDAGFRIEGMTVAKTAFGGSELVSILAKPKP